MPSYPHKRGESSSSSSSLVQERIMSSKRTRGEMACAECRRLKIKCSRTIPCTSCIKRGCTALCPNGNIPPGEGSRFVAAASNHLRSKMLKMEARMHTLENALTVMQEPGQVHPIMRLPFDAWEQDLPPASTLKPKQNSPSPTDAYGTLCIDLDTQDNYGATQRFFGPSGGSESLLLKGRNIAQHNELSPRSSPSSSSNSLKFCSLSPKSPTPSDIDTSYIPPAILTLSNSFILGLGPPIGSNTTILDMILDLLPPRERAIQLAETYLENINWMVQIASREMLFDDLIPSIYDQEEFEDDEEPENFYGEDDLDHSARSPRRQSTIRPQQNYLPKIQTQFPSPRSARTKPITPHTLALLLAIFAIGSCLDLTLPPYGLEGQHYYILATSAMALQPIFMQSGIETVRTLHLLSVYNGLSGRENKMEACYMLLNMAGHVALKSGFHIDPSRWNIEGKEAFDRREYFHGLLTGITWQALVTGRPPPIIASYVSCKLPTEEERRTYSPSLKYGFWRHQTTTELLLPVARATLGTKAPEYAHILELDKKIREFGLPSKEAPVDEEDKDSMKSFMKSHYQDLILLFLHRAFFAQAMTETPRSPTTSPYAYSFFAAYHSACSVLIDTKEQFSKKPLLCARIWRIWSFAFSAAVVVGTVAVRDCARKFKPPPLERFEIACVLFEAAAQTSTRAARALPILHLIRDKARRNDQSYRAQAAAGGVPSPVEDDTDEELSLFGGFTSLLAPERRSPIIPSLPPPIITPQLFDNKPVFLESPPMDDFFHIDGPANGEYESSDIAVSPPADITSFLADQTIPHSRSQNADPTFHGLFKEIPCSYDINMMRPEPGFNNCNNNNNNIAPMQYGHGQQHMDESWAGHRTASFGDIGMLDDRWSSFLYDYGTLAVDPQENRY